VCSSNSIYIYIYMAQTNLNNIILNFISHKNNTFSKLLSITQIYLLLFGTLLLLGRSLLSGFLFLLGQNQGGFRGFFEQETSEDIVSHALAALVAAVGAGHFAMALGHVAHLGLTTVADAVQRLLALAALRGASELASVGDSGSATRGSLLAEFVGLRGIAHVSLQTDSVSHFVYKLFYRGVTQLTRDSSLAETEQA